MKRLLSGFVLVALAAPLSGCYYDPGYSYVRATPYAGPAYYGNGVAYGEAYYASPYWYGGWYDGWYGCCYAPGVAIGGVWYSHGGYRHYRGGGWHGGGQGHWSGGGHGHTSSHGSSGYHH
jgi:hypothetical protein